MESKRQLAAIMFTDIVGYTALMGKDEQQAIKLLDQNRSLHRIQIKKYKGKLLKEMGDGILASFATITDAVYCAAALQRATEDHPLLKLRIGMHEGEVVFQGNDVFGDGVNIASRIQAIAPSGGIWVSEPVSGNIQNKKGISTSFVREEVLKNVKDPVRIYEVKVEGINAADISVKPLKITKTNQKKILLSVVGIIAISLLGYFYQNYRGNASDITLEKSIIDSNSIAVLRFLDMSSVEGNQFFADGLAEELINSLSKVEKLHVTPRTSSFFFQSGQFVASEIGKKLGVNYLLQGSIRAEGEAIRISIGLIDTKKGFQVWSDRYDRTLDSIFPLQDELCKMILLKLEIQLSEREKIRLVEHGTQNTEAYLAYLRGRYYWNKRGPVDLIKAEEYFKLAIREDSLYASAYSGLADSYSISMAYGLRDPQEIAPKISAASAKALEIDPESAEAYTSLAITKMVFERDWTTASENIQHSIRLNPDYPTAHHWYPIYFIARGMMEEALAENRKALLLDPLSPIINVGYGHVLYMARHYDEAFIAVRQGLELAPDMPVAHFILGNILLEKNKPKEALFAYETAFQRAEIPLTIGGLGRAYALLGEIEKANEMLDLLNKKSKTEFVPAIFFAWIYLGLGQKETALDFLEKTVEERGVLYSLYLAVYPFYDELRESLRFISILNKLDLTPPN